MAVVMKRFPVTSDVRACCAFVHCHSPSLRAPTVVECVHAPCLRYQLMHFRTTARGGRRQPATSWRCHSRHSEMHALMLSSRCWWRWASWARPLTLSTPSRRTIRCGDCVVARIASHVSGKQPTPVPRDVQGVPRHPQDHPRAYVRIISFVLLTAHRACSRYTTRRGLSCTAPVRRRMLASRYVGLHHHMNFVISALLTAARGVPDHA